MNAARAVCIRRPYATEDAFLEGDAWTVGRSDMLLLDTQGEPGEPVTFAIELTSGETIVRGEGRILELVGADGGHGGGVRVRFRQLDPASKSTLRRALEHQRRNAQRAEAPAPIAQAEAEPVAAPAEPLPVEKSGVRYKAPPCVAPERREALLERLRDRQRRTA